MISLYKLCSVPILKPLKSDGPLLQKSKLEIFLSLGIFRQGIYKEEKCSLLISDDERIEINLEKRGGSSNTSSYVADVHTLFYSTLHYSEGWIAPCQQLTTKFVVFNLLDVSIYKAQIVQSDRQGVSQQKTIPMRMPKMFWRPYS